MHVNFLRKKTIFHGGNFSDKEIIYPSLSVIVAACNEEESIRQAISQLLDQDYSNLEVIVVNDRSTDHTGDILKELRNEYSQLKVITITDLPPNWLGKNHAVYWHVRVMTTGCTFEKICGIILCMCCITLSVGTCFWYIGTYLSM